MIKIAIADDEKMIREGLASAFDWEENGFEVAGVCRNGQEAYDLAVSEKPDIFLLDICMPKLSGLDLIEKINSELPDMLYIIITGYSEFEYAHRALQLGVFDFVVKPINEDKLWKIITDARDVLISKKEDDDKNESMKRQVESHRTVLQAEFVNRLITRGYDKISEVQKELGDLDLNFGQTPGVLVLRHMAHVAGKKKWSDQLLQFAYKNLIGELCAEVAEEIVMAVDFEGQVIALMNVKDDEWHKLAGKLEQATQLYLGQQTRVELSRVQEDLMNCTGIYEQLDKKLDIVLSDNVATVKRIVETEYGNSELDLNYIADILAVSGSHLSRQVNKEMGINFKEYLIGVRMDKARELVGATDYRFNEIAEMVGYANQHYFTRAFKRVTGMSPSQYRSEAK